jgi:hypothetical protein
MVIVLADVVDTAFFWPQGKELHSSTTFDLPMRV